MLKEYFYSLMLDKRSGILANIAKCILLLVSFGYSAVFKSIKLLYRRGFLKSLKVRAKVISIGNITLGGTGKTPFSIYLAKRLKEDKIRPSIISRGYGEDEKFLFKESIPEVPVFISPKKSDSAKYISENNIADTIILDDGFQHWKLNRDMEIVLVDASNPFGNYYLFPRGILREGLRAFKKADIVVFTKSDFPRVSLNELKEKIKKINENIVFVSAIYKVDSIEDASSRKIDKFIFKDKFIVLLSAIANPDYFKYIAENDLGAKVVKSFEFIDHYEYKLSNIEEVLKFSSVKNSIILTTEKDFVKIKKLNIKTNNLFIMKIRFVITEGEDAFYNRIHSLYNSNSF